MFIVPLDHNSDRATLLDGNCMYHMSAKFKAFHFWTTKKIIAIQLFCCSVFHVLQTLCFLCICLSGEYNQKLCLLTVLHHAGTCSYTACKTDDNLPRSKFDHEMFLVRQLIMNKPKFLLQNIVFGIIE